MVTLPPDAATDFAFVKELINRGADCLRINCAHDDPDAWSGMARSARRVASELDRPLTICMDLAGQKVRITDVLTPSDARGLVAGDLLAPSASDLFPRPDVGFQARCNVAAIIPQLVVGARVSFDDGKMATCVEQVDGDSALLRVTQTGAKGRV